MAKSAEDKNDAIMQRRIAEERTYQGGERRHELPANQEPTARDLSQREVPAADRAAGQTRWSRAPYAGEIVGNKTPPFEVVGLDALSPVLTHVDFPATREEIVDAIGDVQIPIDKMRTKTVREMLADVGPTRFASSKILEDSLARAWDTIAEREGRGGRHWQNDNTPARSNSR